MEEKLVALLLANAGVTALVGSRVYWSRRPQGVSLPAIILHRVSGTRNYTMQGSSGFVQSRVQVDCWAQSYAAAKQAARAVIAAVSGLRNADFQGVFVEGEQDTFEIGAGAAELNRTSLDLIISHPEN